MAVQKFVTLTRVSTKKQGRSGLGLEAQENYINAYLENLHGDYEVIGQFTDIESGKNSNRTGLNEAIELAKDTGAILLVANGYRSVTVFSSNQISLSITVKLLCSKYFF